MKPRSLCSALIKSILFAMPVLACGCSSLFDKKPEKDPLEVALERKAEDGPLLIKHMAQAWGTAPVQVKGVALVTNLRGTGSNPPRKTLDEIVQQR